ncbi:hypothetical protein SCP_0113390 [Sparassis crispa]|uniref:Uncharacterized protein n=1 Tax=Sparassis crispa TaxID=139825 RepID=A0A401G8D7_9APHY|nr:hypothetical protein SCP_0113390 [Sparassis crispa]GBE78450.1 hypothetical protein SCP_0113390 [Sparassis crispa]
MWEFAAPNGLCSSITEAKHIKAVKEPWRRSSRNEALGQMLLTNEALDKLAASRVDFASREMLNMPSLAASFVALYPTEPPQVDEPSADEWINDAVPVPGPTVHAYVTMAITKQHRHSQRIVGLAAEINQPELPALVRRFLYNELHPHSDLHGSRISLDSCPPFNEKIFVHYSAAATFYAPSDPSGIGGMRRKHIRATPSWRKKEPRFDCVFVNMDPAKNRLHVHKPLVARILLFFSFSYHAKRYLCALVRWFEPVGDQPDEDTGMWMVRPALREGEPSMAVIRLDRIYRAAHLIPVFGRKPIPEGLQAYHSLDAFQTFYINKFADHHAFELLSSR